MYNSLSRLPQLSSKHAICLSLPVNTISCLYSVSTQYMTSRRSFKAPTPLSLFFICSFFVSPPLPILPTLRAYCALWPRYPPIRMVRYSLTSSDTDSSVSYNNNPSNLLGHNFDSDDDDDDHTPHRPHQRPPAGTDNHSSTASTTYVTAASHELFEDLFLDPRMASDSPLATDQARIIPDPINTDPPVPTQPASPCNFDDDPIYPAVITFPTAHRVTHNCPDATHWDRPLSPRRHPEDPPARMPPMDPPSPAELSSRVSTITAPSHHPDPPTTTPPPTASACAKTCACCTWP